MRDLQRVNIETHLKNSAIFNELGEEAIAQIAKVAREVRCDRGFTIFHRGDSCTGFHIVVFGQVKLSFTSAQGVEKILEIVQQGQSFGEAMMFLEKPYAVSAQALSSCLLLHISKSAVFSEMERNHGIMRKMIGSLAHQTHHLMLDVEGYTLLTGKQRIISYLLDQLKNGEPGSETMSIDLSVSKGAIASRLNLTKEHFSRILHELSDLDLIRVDGRHLTIPSMKRLSIYQFEQPSGPSTAPRQYGKS